jgi:hypothetical protein
MSAPKRFVHVPILVVIAGGLASVTCGPTLKRDLTKMPVGQVGFDDLCGLQKYFDTLELKEESAPKLVSSAQIENEKTRGGRSRFAFETDFQLGVVRRVLDENWRRLPEGLASAPRVDLEVQWSDRGGLRRVVTNEDASLIIGKESFDLPYHVCLSELLFGAPIYHQRRDALGLAPLPLPKSMVVNESGDGGVPGADADAAGPRTDGRPTR